MLENYSKGEVVQNILSSACIDFLAFSCFSTTLKISLLVRGFLVDWPPITPKTYLRAHRFTFSSHLQYYLWFQTNVTQSFQVLLRFEITTKIFIRNNQSRIPFAIIYFYYFALLHLQMRLLLLSLMTNEYFLLMQQPTVFINESVIFLRSVLKNIHQVTNLRYLCLRILYLQYYFCLIFSLKADSEAV